MSEELFVRQCAPTLAGLKTANLFSACFTDAEECSSQLKALNQRLVKKGICAIPVGHRSGRTLLYVYRPGNLKADLERPESREILKEHEYRCQSLNGCIMQLISRLKKGEEFPHEIGLFLGYPPEDVKAFIHDTRKGVKCTGYWKAYADVENAQKTFARYSKCIRVYSKAYKNGRSLEQLTVKATQTI